jgi:prolipoprotein diacylglyceryltransferase
MEKVFFPMFSVLPCVFGPIAIVVVLFGTALSILAIALWIWMLVDCIQRKDEDFPNQGSDQKLLWILVLILGQTIGALVYYLVVYRKTK